MLEQVTKLLEEHGAEQPEDQTAEQPEEQTAEQEAEIPHLHQIHHPAKKETEEDDRQDDKDAIRNWNSPSLLKLRNPKNSL